MNVEISDVTRRFGRTQAVAGVTMETGPGVFGQLGPNGAGKTTLLRMMATVIPPHSGRVRLLGRDPGGYGPRREIRRRLGYLPQNLGYYPGFTVAEFVEYFALLKEMPPGRVPAAVATAIERVDLGGRGAAEPPGHIADLNVHDVPFGIRVANHAMAPQAAAKAR